MKMIAWFDFNIQVQIFMLESFIFIVSVSYFMYIIIFIERLV